MVYRSRSVTRDLFRALLPLQSQAAGRPLRLNEARWLWQEVHRFLREECQDYLPPSRLAAGG
jgi:hypothetical protein